MYISICPYKNNVRVVRLRVDQVVCSMCLKDMNITVYVNVCWGNTDNIRSCVSQSHVSVLMYSPV